MSGFSMFKTICQGIRFIAPKIFSVESTAIAARTMYHMSTKQSVNNLPNVFNNKIASGNLLQTIVPMYNVVCGLKMKTILHRRCRKCLFKWINGRLYVKCKAHPRHNQVQRQKKPKNTWILTFASQKPIRDW
ncbi:mitochondrial ribosomal protein L36 [Nomia melanderi]|uniref:mitochondrial ribosomal protein L36 n=1 Tax=Nomia melanderi TaxID=2448451 RepID=UPI003FCCC502